MALIAMCVYSTEENGKDEYLERTLNSLKSTVDFRKHRLILSINGKTKNTLQIINYCLVGIDDSRWSVIINPTNLGTAEGINQAWKTRLPGENAVKMDDDVVIHKAGWVDEMEEIISRMIVGVGQIGLKRRDCWESITNEDKFYRTYLVQVPHKSGEKWYTVEETQHVMGTCVMHSSALLDKIGYLKQPTVYGFDDSLMSLRSKLAGFNNYFLCGVDIEHIDRGDTKFQKEKEKIAGDAMITFHTMKTLYQKGEPLYYNPFE